MHGKEKFLKIKETVCDVTIESAIICKILPMPADSNEIFVLKLKRDGKYKSSAYFEPVHPCTMYTLALFKKALQATKC